MTVTLDPTYLYPPLILGGTLIILYAVIRFRHRMKRVSPPKRKRNEDEAKEPRVPEVKPLNDRVLPYKKGEPLTVLVAIRGRTHFNSDPFTEKVGMKITLPEEVTFPDLMQRALNAAHEQSKIPPNLLEGIEFKLNPSNEDLMPDEDKEDWQR